MLNKQDFDDFVLRTFGQSPSWKNIAYFDRFVEQYLPQIFRKYADLRRTVYPRGSQDLPEDQREEYLLRVNYELEPLRPPENGVTPTEARIRDLDYCSVIYVTARLRVYDNKRIKADELSIEMAEHDALLLDERIEHLPVIHLPLIVGSALCASSQGGDALECPLDKGGYFIINGHEKFCTSRDRKPLNRLLIQRSGERSLVGKIRSRAQLCSPSSHAMLTLKRARDDLRFTIEFRKFLEAKAIDVPIAFAILGVPSYAEAMDMIAFYGGSRSQIEEKFAPIWQRFEDEQEHDMCVSDKTILRNVKLQYYGAMAGTAHPFNRAQQQQSAGSSATSGSVASGDAPSDEERMEFLRSRLLKDAFPHCGDALPDRAKTDAEKAYDRAMYLAYCCNEMFKYEQDEGDAVARHDPDHMGNKRFETVDSLIAEIAEPIIRDVFVGKQCYTRAFAGRLAKRPQSIRTMQGYQLVELVRQAVDDIFPNYMSRICIPVATGDWTRKINGVPSTYMKKGITQTLERMNHHQYNSAMNRCNMSLDSNRGQHEKARMPHPTHRKRKCVIETPEGKDCGINGNLTLTCIFSRYEDPLRVLRALHAHADTAHFAPLSYGRAHQDKAQRFAHKVLLNGALVGTTEQPEAFVRRMIALRRERNVWFDEHVGFWYNFIDHCVHIHVEEGRAMSPVEPLPSRLSAEHLEAIRALDSAAQAHDYALRHGLIEYLDFEEEENYALEPALYSRERELELRFYTEQQVAEHSEMHMLAKPELPTWIFAKHALYRELHDSFILGVCASSNPFAEYNQSPRNMYYAAMCKQSLGVPFINSRWRVDTITRELFYCSRPLVDNVIPGSTRTPHGIMEMIAVALYTGQNTEDSIVANDAHCGMGGGMSSDTKTIRHVINPEQAQIFCNPEAMQRLQREGCSFSAESWANYSKIDSLDGCPIPGTMLEKGDAMLGIARLVDRDAKVREYRCASLFYEEKMPSRVVDVIVTSDSEGNRIVKIKLQKCRVPQDGDKFASRHGQKGTYGTLPYLENDMLFDVRNGMVPSKIINPHAFPSRMTGGQVKEGIVSLHAALYGHSPIDYQSAAQHGAAPVYATHPDSTKNARFPFDELDEERIERELIAAGYNPFGECTMKDGRSGRTLRARIFLTPVYYQRLRHMSGDKERSRSEGQRNRITRQPPGGQKNRGAIRFGQMEVNCLEAHGTAAMLHDRLFTNSDKHSRTICERCGITAEMPARDPDGRIVRDKGLWCRICHKQGKKQKVCNVEIPYATFLSFTEEMAAGIVPRIQVN